MIELRHLRYFVALAEELNFRRAAERIHIDQTPLSRTIRDLEEQLGVSLLIRMPRKLQLTPAGECMLKESKKLLCQWERARQAVRATDAYYRTPLRIGLADGIHQPIISERFVSWQVLVPRTPLELMELTADELMPALRNEEVDVGISFGLLDDAAIVRETAWSHPLMAVLPRGHELVSSEKVALADLLAFPMIFYKADRQPGLQQQMSAIVHKYRPGPTIADEASSLAGYVTRVAAGMGVGLTDAGHATSLHRDDVVVLPLHEDEHIITWVVYKRQRFGLHEDLQRFITSAKVLR